MLLMLDGSGRLGVVGTPNRIMLGFVIPTIMDYVILSWNGHGS